jgi:protease-4
MGDVAASGGYYVAVAGDEIWAEPSTITGSIGVFVPRLDASELFAKIGLRLETVKRGASADLFTANRALTAAEKQRLQQWVDSFYQQFLDRVAEGRKLSREQVDEVARGRVWTGHQAQERKLVDKLGGLEDAISAAAGRAGLQPGDEVEVEDLARETPFELTQLAAASPAAAVAWPAGTDGVARREVERALRALALIGEPGTLRASLPYVIEVR